MKPVVEVFTDEYGHKYVKFVCPGCQENHMLSFDRQGFGWSFNGDLIKPTINPSILMRTTKLTENGLKQYEDWINNPASTLPLGFKFDSVDVICHSFVREGKIQFLPDCTHELANQTVDLSPC